MLSKACKSVIVIVCLFFFINFDVNAYIGVVDIDTGRFAENQGILNIELVDKSENQVIVASLIDELGNVVNVVKLNSSFSTKISWLVKAGNYKVVLVNVTTGEREIHYAVF